VRRRPGLDGRTLLADSDIRIIGWQHLAFAISDATAIVRADLAAWGQRKNTMTKKVTHIRQRVRKV